MIDKQNLPIVTFTQDGIEACKKLDTHKFFDSVEELEEHVVHQFCKMICSNRLDAMRMLNKDGILTDNYEPIARLDNRETKEIKIFPERLRYFMSDLPQSIAARIDGDEYLYITNFRSYMLHEEDMLLIEKYLMSLYVRNFSRIVQEVKVAYAGKVIEVGNEDHTITIQIE